jgi:hypothetical protein
MRLLLDTNIFLEVILGLTTVGDFINVYSSQGGAGSGESKASFPL